MGSDERLKSPGCRQGTLTSGNARSATRVHFFVLSLLSTSQYPLNFTCKVCSLCIVVPPTSHPNQAVENRLGICLVSRHPRHGRTKTMLGSSMTSDLQSPNHAGSRDRLDQVISLSRISRIRLNQAKVCKGRWQSSSIQRSHVIIRCQRQSFRCYFLPALDAMERIIC